MRESANNIKYQTSKYQKLEEKIGYKFKNIKHLEESLKHSSKGGSQFQILEFLGDRVLNLCLTLTLIKTNKYKTEGELAQRIAFLASGKTLAQIASKWNLESYILSSKTQTKSILSDAFEAIVGAIFIDSMFDIKHLLTFLPNHFISFIENPDRNDPKTELQEKAHKLFQAIPEYKLISQEGEAHNPTFIIECSIKTKNKKEYKTQAIYKTQATGKSIKEAEKAGAEKMLKQMFDVKL